MLGRHSALIIVVLAWASLTGWAGNVFAQDSIRYTAGPAFQFPVQFGQVSVDFDRDGQADVSFLGGGFLCTTDVPTSSCVANYTGVPMSTNSLLCAGNQFAVLPAGAAIGDLPGPDTSWKGFASASVATYHMNLLEGTNRWLGPLSVTPEGYLGVLFHGPTGKHYGWVRVRLPLAAQNPNSFEFAPVILDWAYESQPDTPIKAGAMPVAAITSPQMVRPQMLRLNWLTEIGQAYQVQFKETLGAPGWSNLDVTVIATSTNAIVDVPMQGNAGFFQAVRTE